MHLICFVPCDVGKYEPQAKPAANPDVTAAKRVKIVEPNKDEDMDEDDVDKDASSNDDSSDEDDVNEAKVFWSIWLAICIPSH